jgi:hypothetical protein
MRTVQLQEHKCLFQQLAGPLALDSSRAVLVAAMLRLINPLRGTLERLLATGERSNTSSGRAHMHLVPRMAFVEWLRVRPFLIL